MADQQHPVILGEVTAPSGILVLVDAGLLGIWDGSRDDLVDTVDLRIEGSDADAAGRRFERSWHPRYLFDVRHDLVDEIRRDFSGLTAEHHLDAQLQEIPDGVPHRQRVDLALEHGGGRCGLLEFLGIRSPVVASVPTDRELTVYGIPTADPDFADRWRWIAVELDEGEASANEEIGDVYVDEARLMFADADALQSWQHEDPLDGRGDYVFWGTDAPTVAESHGAPELEPGKYGWLDLPIEAAVERGTAIEEQRERENLLFAGDFRPHSHHHAILEQMRASTTGSGTLEVGGAKLCAFFTSWGDGIFPVSADLDANGAPLRVWIDLGSEETVSRQRQLEGR